MERMEIGRKSWYRLIPEALKAVISLSPDSLPKERSVPRRNAIGMVKIRKEGEIKRRSIKILEKLTPLFTIKSISLRILSIRRITVKINRPMRKIGVVSLRI